jgi:MYXO-CTERM domain-containing protein
MELDRDAVSSVNGVGVSFGFDTNADRIADMNAIIEHRGHDARSGFVSTRGSETSDTEVIGYENRLGEYFPRGPVALGNVPGAFVITYDIEVSAFSGEIWDINARSAGTYEQWRIAGFDAQGNEVVSELSPVGLTNKRSESLDSRPWLFSLVSEVGITSVTIEHVGNADGVGLAFDNFTAETVPTPGALTGLGLAGLAATGRRRRSA